MAFTLRYGSYSHEAGEAGISITKESLLNEADIEYGRAERWAIRGFLQGDDANDLAAKINAMVKAYSTHYQTMTLLTGGTNAHSLPGRTDLGGLRVLKPPSFPEYQGAEGILYRQYEIEVECRYPTAGGTPLLSWVENLEIIGNGGPRYAVRQPIFGFPQVHQVAEHTPVTAVQSGEAVGMYSYPSVPKPLWPDLLQGDRNRPKYRSPKRRGTKYIEWPVSWSYEFLSAKAFDGRPGRWAG
jgi:hypothetical protein